MSLQDLAYEISYNVDESGLMKSVEMVNNFDSALDGMAKKVDSIASAFSKFNTPIGNLSKSTNDLSVDNLSNSLKNAASNSNELNTNIERQQRLEALVNDYVDQFNAKVEHSSTLEEQLNNRTAAMSSSVQEHIAAQQKLNQEISQSVADEEKLANSANKTAENVGKSVTKANELKTSLSAVGKVSSGIGSILGAFGFIGVGYGIASGIKEVTTAFMDFEQQMAGVHATLGEVADKDLTKLGNKAIEVSNKYAISSKEIAAGEENLASAGFDAKQVMDSLEASTLLSVAGNIKMQESTLDIAAAIRNFNMETKEAAHVADIYAKAAADTAAAMPDMASAMKYIAPVANQAGWSIESTAAAVGVLANSGIKGTSAGTGLRRMFTRLINPTDKAAEKMQALGFEAIDPTTHKIKDIGTLIQDLQGSMKGLDSASKGAALSIIFGVEGLTPMSALMNSSKDEIDKLTKSFQDSDGAAQNMADTMNNTLAGSLRILKENVKNAFIKDIDKTGLGKSLKNFVDGLNDNLPKIVNNIEWFLNKTIDVTGKIKKNWNSVSSTILGVVAAFAVLKTAAVITGVIKTLTDLGKFSGPVIGLAGAAALAARGFLELKRGNTDLGALLLGTAAGIAAISISGGKFLLSGAIGLAAAGFVELKKGNTGLGALLLGTAAGLAAFNVALAITSVLALPVTWPIYAIAGAIGAVTAAVIYVKTHWAESWLTMKAIAIDIINPIIGIIDNLAAAMNSIFGTDFNTNHKITYSESDKKMMKDLGYSDQTISEIAGSNDASISVIKKYKATSGTQAATNIATDKSQSNILDLLPKNANGTNHFEGGLSLVGERGPEIVNIPQGSQVIPASQTSKMLSGSFAQMGTGALGASAELNNSTEKVIADNQKIITGYVDQHKLYGRDSVENFSVALLQNESLSTNATSTLSTDNKNIMNNLSLSGYTYGSGVVNNLAQGVQASEGNLTTVVQTLTDKVIETFKSGFGIHSPSTVMYSMGTNLLQGLVNGMTSKDMGSFVQSWIGSMTSAAGGAMGGNVTGWLTAALGITGTPMSWISGLLRLVQAESGGNPIAWNPISVNGEHATGLLQTLPSTFASYAVKGLGDIFNPIANAAAAINYIKRTYGSVYNTPLFTSAGAYVGYEEGTRNATPGVHLVGEKGPELVWMKGGETVTPNDKISVASQTPYATSNNVSTQLSPSVVIHIHESKNPRATADEVLMVLKKNFGSLFDDKMADIKIQMGLS